MSASNTRRRLSLLTGSSWLAAIVIAGAGGVSLAPTAALAANECGDPSANVATADTFVCAGTFASITYPATNGNLTLQLRNNVTTTTGGLVVTATGVNNANNVTISRGADSPANSGDPSLTSTAGAGLSVTRAAGATGGTISVNLSDNDTTDAPLVISGTTAGVFLQNTGPANATFSSTNGTITASAGAGINVSTTSLTTGNLTVTNGSTVAGSTYGLRVATPGAGTIVLTNNGSLTGGAGAILVESGVDATLTNSATGTINGGVTLGNTGTTAFANNGVWNTGAGSAFGGGATTLTNSATGTITAADGAVVDFGDGVDGFINSGFLILGGVTEGEATLTFTGLDAWANNTTILFGRNAGLTNSDGAANDRIVANGAAFTGTDASTLVMDVDLTADQANCEAAVAADCLDLRGGTAAGATLITITNVGGGFEPGHRLVVVDVAGGSSIISAFRLDPTTPGYRRVGDADTIETGPFVYGLVFDPFAQQHLIVTGFNDEAHAVSRIGRAVTEPWRTVSNTAQNRQADLRGAVDGQPMDAAPGVWLRLASNTVDEQGIDIGGAGIEYNGSFDQSTVALTGGVDLLRHSGEDASWLAGVTAGKLESTLDYRSLDGSLELDGASFGVYGSFTAGAFHVDGVVAATSIDFTYSDGAVDYEGSATSIGFQAEAGYRLLQLEAAYIEPLVAVSRIKTEVDDMAIGTATIAFDEANSTRAGVGVRIGGAFNVSSIAARVSLTGRVWDEFEGENSATFTDVFGEASLVDSRQETLGDVGFGVGLVGPGGRLSADFGYGLTFREQYTSSEASISLRFQW